MSDQNSITKQLVNAIRFFGFRFWTPATSSNFSYRFERDEILITSSGVDKSQIEEHDFLWVGRYGEPHDTKNNQDQKLNLKPSAETLIHTFIYDHDKKAKCVLHTHSVFSTLLSERMFLDGEISFEGLEILKAFEGVTTHLDRLSFPIVDNDQDMKVICRKLETLYDQGRLRHGFFIRGHGLYAWGEDVAKAKARVEAMEFLLELRWRELQVG